MAIISDGTAAVVNGSNIVTLTGGLVLDRGVQAGDLFKVDGYPTKYHIAVTPTTNTTLTLLEDYAGITESGKAYQIFVDFIDYQLSVIQGGTIDNEDLIARNFEIVADQLAIAGASATAYRKTPLFYLGEPVQGKKCGYIKWKCPSQLAYIAIGTDDDPPDNPVTVDFEINGINQNINLVLPAGSRSKISALLTINIVVDDYTEFEWITVNLPAGGNYHLEFIWFPNSPLDIRYDFTRFNLGDLVLNKQIGRGFKFPVKSKVFGFGYSIQGNLAEGGNATISLYKNGVALGTPVTGIITEGVRNNFVALTQTDFLITDECTLCMTVFGGIIPASDVNFILYSYRIE